MEFECKPKTRMWNAAECIYYPSLGQYGIKRSGKANILLDRNGNVMLCVDNLLNGFPCMVVVLGCVVCLLMIALPKSLSVVRTVVYIAFILYEN